MSSPATLPSKDDYGISPENMMFLQQYIERESGIALSDDKQYLLHSRLMPLMTRTKLPSLNELCEQLRSAAGASLRRLVVEAMTTHETLFFRDIAVFNSLRTMLIPEMAKQRGMTKSLRIWSAACSSGQEAYSVAMLLHEAGYGDWNIQIVGTDLSTQILQRAAAGCFLQMEVNRGLPSAMLVKYFQRSGKDWQIKDSLRRMVSFSQFDLRNDMRSLGFFDLVLCRNVLIYFDAETRRKVLAGIYGTLYPGGYLLLGSSETTLIPENTFTRKTHADIVFYQRP